MIAIIDYDAGNLTSVERAVRHLGYDCTVTKAEKIILEAQRVIFPGVGAAGSAMASLARDGLDELILKVFQQGKPILGICLGTQIILEKSEEDAALCLGIVKGSVQAFPKKMQDENGSYLKIPHMGWNQVQLQKDHPVFSGLDPEDSFYFVHSYYPEPAGPEHVIGKTPYGILFPSAIGFDNIVATQFHPEKSGNPGLRILHNFLEWNPC